MVENNSADKTLCLGTLQISGINQNTSYIICCITTRFKLLINDCVKIIKYSEGTAIAHSYFPFCAAGIPLCSHLKTV